MASHCVRRKDGFLVCLRVRGCAGVAGKSRVIWAFIHTIFSSTQRRSNKNCWTTSGAKSHSTPCSKIKQCFFFHNLVHRYIPPLSERTSMSLKLSMWHWVHCICYEVVIWLFPPRIERVFFHWKSNKNNWNKDTDIILYRKLEWHSVRTSIIFAKSKNIFVQRVFDFDTSKSDIAPCLLYLEDHPI